ncbi:pseudouridine synthase [Bombardia bombarda]|uniref:Pseudouridine synthase n=1 Tax=Bombardia bombarda TaxID=252184 RepID=A0AA40BW13_9PEZI|nr:pseudouridine synthase [Bombardia bombarda]
MAAITPAGTPPPDYSKYTKDALLKRVKFLENELRRRPEPASPLIAPPPPPPPVALPPTPEPAAVAGEGTPTVEGAKAPKVKNKKLDPARYSTRLIALKLAYLGSNYYGFEYQATAAVPTIEEELWKALTKSCLINPERPEEVDFGPYEYSKCGRTDRGVSAFGQVIGIRVRSNRPVPKEDTMLSGGDPSVDPSAATTTTTPTAETAEVVPEIKKPEWDPIADEIAYCRVLNRLLPPDIRILAWAPTLPKDFSARFSCRERQYRYFFTQPAFSPMPSLPHQTTNRAGGKALRDGWLDLDAMKKAAKMFEGVHDFRNFCKIDPAKQMTIFMRRVFEADIVEVKDVDTALPYLNRAEFNPYNDNKADDAHPKVYYFHVRGSAFLWHQIRHMIAILFLVGQGLEPPSVITDLLDVDKNPRRPGYLMADEVPLVLWDCIFPVLPADVADEANAHDPAQEERVETNNVDSIDWLWLGEDNPLNLHGSSGLVDHLWAHWRGKKMEELLANRLLDCVASKADLGRRVDRAPVKPIRSQKIYDGGNAARYAGSYIPVLKRPLLGTVQEQNDKWAQSKGFASGEEMTRNKLWRAAIKERKRGGGSGSGSGRGTPVEVEGDVVMEE